MISLLKLVVNFFKKLQIEHEITYDNIIGKYITYETMEDVYIIATNPFYESGLYVNENDPSEFFVKNMMDDGLYAIGIDANINIDKTLFVSTNDGGMVKDDDTWVSNNKVEIYLTNLSALEYKPFNLLKIETDNKINVTIWYRQEPDETKNKRGRKKKNV